MTRMITDEDRREQRLITFHERNVQTLMRKETLDDEVQDAIGIAQDPRLPRHSIEFRLGDANFASGWLPAVGLGLAMETYVNSLDELHRMRMSRSCFGSYAFLQPAFGAVKDAAKTLAHLGWPVNWEQNVQLILELTEVGIQDGVLVDRFEDLPAETTLGRRLEALGGLAFYIQRRVGDKITSVKMKLLAGRTKELFEMTPLRLRTEQDRQPEHVMYTSDWIVQDNPTKSLRVYV